MGTQYLIEKSKANILNGHQSHTLSTALSGTKISSDSQNVSKVLLCCAKTADGKNPKFSLILQ